MAGFLDFKVVQPALIGSLCNDRIKTVTSFDSESADHGGPGAAAMDI
jgi:hypothetical protein